MTEQELIEFKVFKEWPKISRHDSPVTVSEKIDGTNSAIVISDCGTEFFCQSRNKIITPGKTDNAGFAGWVESVKGTLIEELGPGYHYGEWCGSGLQRNYGLKHKEFRLFNTRRWSGYEFKTPNVGHTPVLYEGPCDWALIQGLAEKLRSEGSVFAPGFMRPEGMVIYYQHDGSLKKYILDK